MGIGKFYQLRRFHLQKCTHLLFNTVIVHIPAFRNLYCMLTRDVMIRVFHDNSGNTWCQHGDTCRHKILFMPNSVQYFYFLFDLLVTKAIKCVRPTFSLEKSLYGFRYIAEVYHCNPVLWAISSVSGYINCVVTPLMSKVKGVCP